MKIFRLTAENIKRLRAVEITPDGAIVTIAGKNGQGKSSILDSILWALGGAGVIQGEPIRKGENKARVKLELGDGHEVELIAERTFEEGKSKLTFKNANGSKTKLPPQEMADSLIGALSFDPMAFSRLKAREQFDALRKIANLDVDLDALDAANAEDYERRREINREADRNRKAAELIPIAVAAAVVDVAGIQQQLRDAGKRNETLSERREKRRAFEKSIEECDTLAASARERAAEMRQKAEFLENQAMDLEASSREKRETLAASDPIPDPVDVADLLQQLEAAQQANREAEAAKADENRRKALNATAKELEDQSEALTAAMAARTEEKAAAIARAALPVPGLGFGDGIVTYNGIPFDQAGTAERWRVCIAVAMANNPKLRVIRVDEGSLLDSDSMDVLREMAEEHDFQVWCEVVDDNPESGFVIEDGMVKE